MQRGCAGRKSQLNVAVVRARAAPSAPGREQRRHPGERGPCARGRTAGVGESVEVRDAGEGDDRSGAALIIDIDRQERNGVVSDAGLRRETAGD